MVRKLFGTLALSAVIVTVLGGCAGERSPTPNFSATSTPPASAATPPASIATPTASAAPTSVTDSGARTLRTIANEPDATSTLAVGSQLAANAAYLSHVATYESDGLTISAVLNEPIAPGVHPGVVLVHGFVDPATYTSGGELQLEQDFLARAGYVVLYTDLRGLGGSDPAPAGPPDLEMGITADVINAVHALAASGRTGLDADHIFLLGHSLGGLVALNVLVAKPGLVDAAVAFAPSNPDRWVDVQQYLAPGDPAYEAIVVAHGTPTTNPTYWADVSPLTFVDNVTDPLLIVHGDADQDSPYEWSVATVAAWQSAGKDVQLQTLAGEGHVFEARWAEAMDAVVAFFAQP